MVPKGFQPLARAVASMCCHWSLVGYMADRLSTTIIIDTYEKEQFIIHGLVNFSVQLFSLLSSLGLLISLHNSVLFTTWGWLTVQLGQSKPGGENLQILKNFFSTAPVCFYRSIEWVFNLP